MPMTITESPRYSRVLNGIPAAWGCTTGPAAWGPLFPDTPFVLLARALTADVAMTAILEGAVGVVSAAGGATSHGAVLLRHHCIPCVSGVTALEEVPSGVMLSVDGTKGEVSWSL